MQRARGSSARLVVALVALVTAAALSASATGRAATRTSAVTLRPTITSFTPTRGALRRLVTITGDHFRSATTVKFGCVAAMFTVISRTQISVNVPPGAVTDFISVTNPAGKATSTVPFTVLPRIRTFSPMSGHEGTLVKITGTTFGEATAVYFGSVAAHMGSAVVSPNSIKVKIPAGAVTGKIFVTTPAGTTHSATNFAVTP